MSATRREALLLLTAAGCGAVPEDKDTPAVADSPAEIFRMAVCNETFDGSDFAGSCSAAIRTGYTGLEIAPFTLSDDPTSIPAAQRKEYRKIIESEGLGYVGLHSLLSVPKGALHITTPDDAVRTRSWDYFRRLIDLCADLGDEGLMILGSGKQRCTIGGASIQDARQRLRDGLVQVAPHAQERGVTVLPETLAPHLCDVLTSLDDTVQLVKEIDHPAIQTMFDTHNAAAETIPHDQLINTYAAYIKHVHINEMDGRHPGTGSYDFSIPLQALKDIAYDGWVSLEVFRFEPSGEEVARTSSAYLRKIESNLR